MITKETAGILFAYGYQLVDKESLQLLTITGLRRNISDKTKTVIETDRLAIDLDQIGTYYFILARPLSGLTKEIEHNGERFVPIERLNDLNGTVAEYSHNYPVKSLPNWMVEKLYSWHFNIDFPEGTTKNLE